MKTKGRKEEGGEKVGGKNQLKNQKVNGQMILHI